MKTSTICRAIAICQLIAVGMMAPVSTLRAEEVQQGETVIVDASQAPRPTSNTGTSNTVLNKEAIEQQHNPILSDLLRDIPGLAVSRSGGLGSLTQVRIRGAEARHTLVLIDGIEVGDPVNGSEFDFATLLSDNIERIEVLRGPQSALYGSDAIGGVINIITQRGKPGLHADGFAEAGSFGTSHVRAGLSGGDERFDFAANVSHLETQGINLSRSGNEKDGYRNTTGTLKGGSWVGDNLRLDAVLRKTRTHTDLDDPSSGVAVDSSDFTVSDQLYGRVQGKLSLLDGRWEHIFGASLTETSLENVNSFANNSEGRKSKFDYRTNYSFGVNRGEGASHGVTLGVEQERTRFVNAIPGSPADNQSHKDRVTSFIGEYRFGWSDRLFITAGGRHDNNELFKDEDTYRLTAAYLLPASGTRLHSSYGTGVKSPAFFDLFGFLPSFFVGNPNLFPERSRGYDIGVGQMFFNHRFTADLTYFKTDLRDAIQFSFPTVVNLTGTSKRQGWELSAQANLGEDTKLSASYTYTDARDPDGREAVRRARHLASLNLNRGFADRRGNINLSVKYNGAQQDTTFDAFFNPTRVTLGSYTLVNVAASYRIGRYLELLGRVENLLDRKYEEVFSFRTPGIGAFAGIRIATD